MRKWQIIWLNIFIAFSVLGLQLASCRRHRDWDTDFFGRVLPPPSLIDVLHTANSFTITNRRMVTLRFDEQSDPEAIALLRSTLDNLSHDPSSIPDCTINIDEYNGIDAARRSELAYYLYDPNTGKISDDWKFTRGYYVPEKFRELVLAEISEGERRLHKRQTEAPNDCLLPYKYYRFTRRSEGKKEIFVNFYESQLPISPSPSVSATLK